MLEVEQSCFDHEAVKLVQEAAKRRNGQNTSLRIRVQDPLGEDGKILAVCSGGGSHVVQIQHTMAELSRMQSFL